MKLKPRTPQERVDRGFMVVALALGGLLLIGQLFGGAWASAAACLALVVTGVLAVVRRRRRRRNAAENWAHEHGWHYAAVSAAVPRSGSNVLRGTVDGVDVASYTTVAAPDLRSETTAAKPRHAVSGLVPGAYFPELVILPEALSRRPGAAALDPDIQFESAAFNARWRVHCADATFAHAFCHPRLMARLMEPDAAGVSVLVERRDVVVHAPGLMRLDLVEERAALVADLVHLVPPYLLHEHPGPTRRRRPVRRVTVGDWVTRVVVLVPLGLLLWGARHALEAGLPRYAASFTTVAIGYLVILVHSVRSEARVARKARARGSGTASAERSRDSDT